MENEGIYSAEHSYATVKRVGVLVPTLISPRNSYITQVSPMVGELFQAAVKNIRKKAGISGFSVIDTIKKRVGKSTSQLPMWRARKDQSEYDRAKVWRGFPEAVPQYHPGDVLPGNYSPYGAELYQGRQFTFPQRQTREGAVYGNVPPPQVSAYDNYRERARHSKCVYNPPSTRQPPQTSASDPANPMPEFRPVMRSPRHRGIGSRSSVSRYDPMPKYKVQEDQPTKRGIGGVDRVYGWSGQDPANPMPEFRPTMRSVRRRGIGNPYGTVGDGRMTRSTYDPMPKYKVNEDQPTKRGIGGIDRVYGWQSRYDAMPTFRPEDKQLTRRGIGQAARVYGWSGYKSPMPEFAEENRRPRLRGISGYSTRKKNRGI